MYQVTEIFFLLDLLTLKRNILKTFDFSFDFAFSIKNRNFNALHIITNNCRFSSWIFSESFLYNLSGSKLISKLPET